MNEIAKLYVELGILGLIAVLFIWTAFKKDKDISDKFDTLFVKLLERRPITEEENKAMTRMEAEINKYLKKLLESTKADRVFLMRYHNGGKDLLGNSFLKMSITNEQVQSGVQYVTSIFANQFRGTFFWMIKPLEKRNFIYSATKSSKDKPEAIEFIKSRGIKEYHCIGIENENNTTIGYISVEYVSSEPADIEQIKHCLKDKKIKVETLLNLNDK